jgi:hypothetical protein
MVLPPSIKMFDYYILRQFVSINSLFLMYIHNGLRGRLRNKSSHFLRTKHDNCTSLFDKKDIPHSIGMPIVINYTVLEYKV